MDVTMLWFAIALAVVVGLALLYAHALERRLRMRRFSTTIEPAKLRQIFEATVAITGWKIVVRGNPMLAQSPIAMGRRQEIHLRIEKGTDGAFDVEVGPVRVILGGPILRVPLKAHTLNFRLVRFARAIQKADPSVEFVRSPRPMPSGSSSWL